MIYTPLECVVEVCRFFFLVIRVLLYWPIVALWSLVHKSRKDVSREIVFITGAGSGIGRLMSYRLAALGAHLICTDIDEKSCKETADEIASKGGKAVSFRLDVSRREDVYKLADEIRKQIGDVTMLINNAGIVTGKSILECPDAVMVKTVDVNTVSHFWTIKAFLEPMMKRNRGHIVSIASLAGFAGSPGLVDYVASKFGAVGLMEALTMEMWDKAEGVKTTIIAPWFIKTGMFAGALSASPFLFPMLSPDEAVDAIVDGILAEESVVFVPRRLYFVVLLKSMLPTSVGKLVYNYMQLGKQMENFVGRHKKE